MGLKPYQETILERLALQEQLLSQLYSAFARSDVGLSEFWTQLAQEESRHAQVVSKLQDAARKGVVVFDEGPVRQATLDAFIQRLESLVQRAEAGEFSRAAALAMAEDYETALIERNTFSRFVSANDKAIAVLKVLQEGTLAHIDRVRQMRRTGEADL